MAKIQAVWALDIGQAALKALKLVPGETPDQVEAEAFDFIEYPKILSQPDADPEELISQALITLMERNELKGSRVAIAVPGQAGLVKFIKLPPVEKKRIPDIVKFEARQQIPFALEEVVWDYQAIGGEDDDDDDSGFSMAEVGLFAIKREQINRALFPLQNAGIEVDVVQMSPIALFNFIAFDRLNGDPEATAAGSTVLLDIGADNTDLIITDGKRIWQRNVPIGGNHFTRALTKELKLTFAKAEHLKRNATKAPDPRAVFTAMRGVFNDFSSEINRSIGFYSSVNRSAKIAKIIGVGNGFKLPGLQKFLQQNLSYEVERLETFEHLEGEEVTSAPQFQENLPSFAVAYGLGVQGLEISPLRTNLLPPEIQQVRMVRRKKPWALAAAALLMIGASSLFLGNWRAWASVSDPAFDQVVSQAKSVAETGNANKSAFDGAKSTLSSKIDEGKALVAVDADATNWPALLRKISEILPNPTKDWADEKVQVDMNKPESQLLVDQSRLYIDAIVPVWREDLNAEWFEELDPWKKNLMLPYDRKNPPTGAGWIVQVIGHHYNPPSTLKSKKGINLGPVEFLIRRFIRRLGMTSFRMFGISHPVLSQMFIIPDWTGDKAGGGTARASGMVLLPRATPPAAEGGMGGESGYGGRPVPGGGRPTPGGGGYPGGGGGRPMPGGGGYGGEGGGYSGRDMSSRGFPGGAGVRGPTTGPQQKIQQTVLTRTDFMVQFIWQPPTEPLTDEEREAKLKTLVQEIAEAEKSAGAIQTPSENVIVARSAAELKQATESQAATAPGTATPPGGAVPGGPSGAAAPETQP